MGNSTTATKKQSNEKRAKDLKRHSSKDIEMGNKHIKRFNIIREMQIKTIMRYHFIPTRAVMKKKGNIKCW